MKITRVTAAADELLNPDAAVWSGVSAEGFDMVPAPLKGNPMIKHVSPFIEKSTGHGTVGKLTAAGVHNGKVLALRLSWSSRKHDKVIDLDEFVDGVAVMFPLGADADAMTMGSKGKPVNAWYWKANLDGTAFDVVAEGYGTSTRGEGGKSQVRVGASHKGDTWHVVLSRPLDIGKSRARFRPGASTELAFAVWDGGNRERAGRKSFSGGFETAELDA